MMIFIDSNIPMYIIGADHPNKNRCRIILENLIANNTRLVTSAEIIQEICHRYKAIDRTEYIQIAVDALYGIIDEVYSITEKNALNSKDLLLLYPSLSSRDSLHISVMQNLGIKKIFSFDSGFDQIQHIERIY